MRQLRLLGFRTGVVGAVLLGLAACAGSPQPPDDELAGARLAVKEAENSLASEYAVNDVIQARQKLDQAEAAYESEKYRLARRLAEQALADARLAETRADAILAEASLEEADATLKLLRERRTDAP